MWLWRRSLVGSQRPLKRHYCVAASEERQPIATKREKRRPSGHWDTQENREAFLRDVEQRLGISSAEEWKTVRAATVADLGGSGLLARYGNSVARLLADCGPQSVGGGEGRQGKTTRAAVALETRKHMPKGFWKKRDNCRRFLMRFAEANNIKGPAGWRKVSKRELRLSGGSGLLLQYSGSLINALHDTLYRHMPPELLMTDGRGRARGHWDDPRNRRVFLASFCRDADIELPSDWRRVTANQVAVAGGTGLLKKFGGSLPLTVRSVFPGRPLGAISEAGEVLEEFWKEEANARLFFDRLRRSLSIDSFLEMGKISDRQIVAAGGEGILLQHGGSALAAMSFAYCGRKTAADYGWEGPSFWGAPANVRAFLGDVAERYHWSRLPLHARWNSLTKGHLLDSGGRGLLTFHGNSVLRVLQCAFPDGNWSVKSTSECVGDSHWEERENIASFMHSLAEELALNEPEDWYRVSHAQLRENGAAGMMRTVSLANALSIAYPSVPWAQERLAASSKKASQRHLTVQVSSIFLPQRAAFF